jgi:hypothetical protein
MENASAVTTANSYKDNLIENKNTLFKHVEYPSASRQFQEYASAFEYLPSSPYSLKLII